MKKPEATIGVVNPHFRSKRFSLVAPSIPLAVAITPLTILPIWSSIKINLTPLPSKANSLLNLSAFSLNPASWPISMPALPSLRRHFSPHQPSPPHLPSFSSSEPILTIRSSLLPFSPSVPILQPTLFSTLIRTFGYTKYIEIYLHGSYKSNITCLRR